MITANPKTSGGARWNFLGLWGSVTQTGGSEAKAKSFITNVYRNVDVLPKDAREATDTFVKRRKGDVLLNYENEAILAKEPLENPSHPRENTAVIAGGVSAHGWQAARIW